MGLPVDECEKGNPPKLQRRRVLFRRVPPEEAVGATALAVGLHRAFQFPRPFVVIITTSYLPFQKPWQFYAYFFGCFGLVTPSVMRPKEAVSRWVRG